MTDNEAVIEEYLKQAQRKLESGFFAYPKIPDYIHQSIIDYVLHGLPPGHFLTAVLENDLAEAVSRADATNFLAIAWYVLLLYNGAPAACWGSPSNVEYWIKIGGLEGTYRLAATNLAAAGITAAAEPTDGQETEGL